MSDGLSPRARARLDTIDRIKQIARRQLAADGPDISLRAVARDLGVVSSGVYRYFASRDDLLTALIIDGYDSMGRYVEDAEARVPRRDVGNRWLAVGRAVRQWSQERPHEFALLYGSPVPGYSAPVDTMASAARVVVVAMQVLLDAVERGVLEPPADRLAKAVRNDADRVAVALGLPRLPATLTARAMTVWAHLFGAIGFELFGRYQNVVLDPDAHFEYQLKAMSRYLGLS